MQAILLRSMTILALLLSATGSSFAQADTARLQGTLTDPQGAAIAGASVRVTNLDTGREVETTTNDLGYYTISALPAGHYRVEVIQKGFKKVSRTLDLQIAQIGVADFQVQLGEVTDSVTVE